MTQERRKADKIKKIVFACDAGMGSSAMGATKFRNRVKAQRPDLTVINTSVDNIPADADVVVCQYILQDRAVKSAPQARFRSNGNIRILTLIHSMQTLERTCKWCIH